MALRKKHTWRENVCVTCGCTKITEWEKDTARLIPIRIIYYDKNLKPYNSAPQCFDSQLGLFDGYQIQIP